MGIKKIARGLKMPIALPSDRAIRQKWTSAGTVANSPAKGPKVISPTPAVRRMVREAEMSSLKILLVNNKKK